MRLPPSLAYAHIDRPSASALASGMASTTADFAQKYGKWAVVTGASSGIGTQFARALAKRGLDVVLIARRGLRLSDLAADIRARHRVQTRVVVADLTDAGGLRQVEAAVSDLDVGLLVNNAGMEIAGAFMDAKPGDIAALIALNVAAVARLASTVGGQVARRGRGGLIFVSSINARPLPYNATYAASKAFVSTLAVSMRYELVEKGVDVLCFEPGLVESEMSVRVMERFGEDVMPTPMQADRAVEMCLDKLGKTTVFTPGFRNVVLKKCIDFLPFLILPVLARTFATALAKRD